MRKYQVSKDGIHSQARRVHLEGKVSTTEYKQAPTVSECVQKHGYHPVIQACKLVKCKKGGKDNAAFANFTWRASPAQWNPRLTCSACTHPVNSGVTRGNCPSRCATWPKVNTPAARLSSRAEEKWLNEMTLPTPPPPK